MRTRLFALTTKLRRACAREPVLENANAEHDDSDDLLFGLALEMRRTRMALVKRVSVSLRPYQFNEAQWRVLRILAQWPGVGWTVKGLGRRGCFHFSDPVVRRALVTLHERGLIRRSAILRPMKWRIERKQPQRQFRAEINRAGLDMVKRIEARQTKDNADLFERLDAREMAQLDALLGQVTCALLWRSGVAAEDQVTHPFAAQYGRFDAYVKDAARALARENRQLKEAGLPVRRRRAAKWWE
jgi:DNA-binding MarR family transcriptional regulator